MLWKYVNSYNMHVESSFGLCDICFPDVLSFSFSFFLRVFFRVFRVFRG